MKSCTFHDLESGQYDRRYFEIVERAYMRREKVLVYASGQKRAGEIDRVLWILKQEAFIPHAIYNGKETLPDVPVLIVTEEVNPIDAAVLIADGHCSIEFACKFDAVHEFVNRSTSEMHEACRERFRSYRARNIPVKHTKR